MEALARTLCLVARRVVVLFVVLGAPACQLDWQGRHCLGLFGTPDEIAAQLLLRGVFLTLTVKIAQRQFPLARVQVILLGSVVTNAIIMPGRTTESGFVARAAAGRLRTVDVHGSQCVQGAELPVGVKLYFFHELAAPNWAMIYGNTQALRNGARALNAGILTLARDAGWLSADVPARSVFDSVQRIMRAARLVTLARAAQLIGSSAAFDDAAEEDTLPELASLSGLRLFVWHDRAVRLRLPSGTHRLALPRGSSQRDRRLYLLPGEAVLLFLDVALRLLFMAREPHPTSRALLLLHVIELDATHPLVVAVAEAGVSSAKLPPLPHKSELPMWVPRNFAADDEALTAVTQRAVTDAACNASDAARLAARAEFFCMYRIPEISAAAQRWAFVAAKAVKKADRETWRSYWLNKVAEDALRLEAHARHALQRVEAGELEWADEAEIHAFDAYLSGEHDTLGSLACPPLPDAEALAAAENVPPAWLLSHMMVGEVETEPAKPYRFIDRPGLCAGMQMATRAFACMKPMDPVGVKGVDVMRMAVELPIAWGTITLGVVLTAEYAYSGVAAGLVALAIGVHPPLPATVLEALLPSNVVAAARAMPELRDRTSAALREAIYDSCRALFETACRGLAERRECDLVAKRWEVLLDEMRHLQTLITASHAATPEALVAQRRAFEAPALKFSLVTKHTGSHYIARLVNAMGVECLGCTAPTADLAARVADLLRKMLNRPSKASTPWNFPDQAYEQVIPLLPRVLPELQSRGGGNDTPALEILRANFLRPLVLAGAYASAAHTGVMPLSPTEYDALKTHIRRLRRELEAAMDDVTTGDKAQVELDAWVQGGGGWRDGRAPDLVPPMPTEDDVLSVDEEEEDSGDGGASA